MITSIAAPTNLREAIRYFADPDRALAFVVQLRWPDGVICPACEGRRVSFLKSRRIWKCLECHRQFSAKLGTIFEDSALGLDKWLPALYMLANCKNGISSYEVARSLGVTQKTAWFMLGRIRLAMQTRSFRAFEGEVEVDEAFIGGLAKFMHKSKKQRVITGTGGVNKTAVMGILERGAKKGGSKVKATVLRDRAMARVRQEIMDQVAPGSKLYTDTAWNYGRKRQFSRLFRHRMINHAKQYVKGRVHTNGLENFWSLDRKSTRLNSSH